MNHNHAVLATLALLLVGPLGSAAGDPVEATVEYAQNTLLPQPDGPPTQVPEEPEAWLFAHFDQGTPTVLRALGWDTTLFNLHLDATGHAAPGDTITLEVHTGEAILRYHETIQPDLENSVTFRDIPATQAAQYTFLIGQDSYHLDPYQPTPHEAVPDPHEACPQDEPECDVLEVILDCLVNLDCGDPGNELTPCQDATLLCSVILYIADCLQSIECSDPDGMCEGTCPPTDVCEYSSIIPGTCGTPIKEGLCALQSITCNIRQIMKCLFVESLDDLLAPDCIYPCDGICIDPGTCDELGPLACQVVQAVAECLFHDPECLPTTQSQPEGSDLLAALRYYLTNTPQMFSPGARIDELLHTSLVPPMDGLGWLTPPSSQAVGLEEIARHDGILVSSGGAGDQGLLIDFPDAEGRAPYHLDMKLCYVGNTNNDLAVLKALFNNGQYGHSISWRTPYTGNGSCNVNDASTFFRFQFTWQAPSTTNGIRFEYLNGDDRLAVADIVIWTEAQGNQPPNAPNKPSGDASVMAGSSYFYSTSGTDPDGDSLRYEIDWGDGVTETIPSDGYLPSGWGAGSYHAWSAPGTYSVRVRAEDSLGLVGPWSVALVVNVAMPENMPPAKPDAPEGRSSVDSGRGNYFTARTTDPEGDRIRYEFFWGDGTTSWSPQPGSWAASGSTRSAFKSWTEAGTYHVNVRAIDEHGAVSPLSNTRVVQVYPDYITCRGVVDFEWKDGYYGHGWTGSNDIEPGAWKELGWGGWKYHWKYYPDCEPDLVTEIEPVFGFSYYGHNWVSGEMVVRFGGAFQGEQDWGRGTWSYAAKLHGLQFFYRTPEAQPAVRPYAAELEGRPGSSCPNWWTSRPEPAKFVLTLASEVVRGLGTTMYVADKFCEVDDPRVVRNHGGPGYGLRETEVYSQGSSQMVSAYINVDYENVPKGAKFPVDLTASIGHRFDTRDRLDEGRYEYTVKPFMQRAG